MSYLKNKEAIKRELNLFWDNVGDIVEATSAEDPLDRPIRWQLYRRNVEAYTLVCSTFQDLRSHVSEGIYFATLREGRIRNDVVAEFGRRFSLNLLERELIKEESLKWGKDLLDRQRAVG